MKKHKDSVHKEVRYPCDQCNYAATTRGSLYEHAQSYHEAANFNCNQCDYTVSTKTNLNKHKEDSHEEKEKVTTEALDQFLSGEVEWKDLNDED